MHTLEDIRREYDRLDRLCGVDTRSIRLKQSPTSVQRLGAFRYPLRTGGGPLQISVSPVVLQNDNLFLDTIRHEYAHALVYLRTKITAMTPCGRMPAGRLAVTPPPPRPWTTP